MKQVHSEFKITTRNYCLGNVAPAAMHCAAFATKIIVTCRFVKFFLHHKKVIKAVKNVYISTSFTQNFDVFILCIIYFALFLSKVFAYFQSFRLFSQ